MATGRSDAFLRQLRAAFLAEARDHVHLMSMVLSELSRGGVDVPARVEAAFRAAHSLKGAARAVEIAPVEALCQSLEDVLAGVRERRLPITADLVDASQRAVDAVASYVEGLDPATGVAGAAAELRTARDALRTTLSRARMDADGAGGGDRAATDAAESGEAGPAAPRQADVPAADAWVRVALDKLEANQHEAEDLQFARMAARQRMRELRDLATQFDEWRRRIVVVTERERSVAIDPGRVELLNWCRETGRTLARRVDEAARHARTDFESLSKSIDGVQERAKELLALPLASLTRAMPRLVRALARQQRKSADLELVGDEVTLDRRVVERLKDPLLHLLRNAVDHGVEPTERRVAAGKPELATLRIAATVVDGRTLALSVSDDGAGVDLPALRRRVVERRLVTADEAEQLDDAALLRYVFASGLSTRDAVTELSGRGLGLAIVREVAEALGGRVDVESTAGEGTTVRIDVPLAFSADRGILIRVADRLLLVPARAARSVGRAAPGQIGTVASTATLAVAGRTMPLVDLAIALSLPRSGKAAAGATFVVVGSDADPVAFLVDDVLGEREAVVRPMPPPLDRVPYVDGVAIIGAGVVVPVVAVGDVLGAVRRLSALSHQPSGAGSQPAPQRTILIAEDSITSRLLLKAILESAGYRVRTAVDGRDAYQQLLAGAFTMLVSDVDMPHLDGCELTTRLRAQPRFSALPIVLVSARERPEDRVRGLQAGANAYLGKRSFDRDELLRIVGELL